MIRVRTRRFSTEGLVGASRFGKPARETNPATEA